MSTASDVYSLGVMVYEMLTAQLPWPEATDRASLLRHQLEDPLPTVESFGLPAAIDEVISTATAKAPGLRFASAPELAEALRQALNLAGMPAAVSSGAVAPGTGAMTAITRGDNPFVGLDAFDEADAPRFFGRERIVEELIDRLSTDRLAVVLGASGSGKSSVVRAGLIPAVRRGDIAGSDRWYVATMMPGADPFSRLRDALSGIAASPEQVPTVEELRCARGIASSVQGLVVADEEPGVLILVLDQLEELFSQSDTVEANRFLDGLADAVADPGVSLRVVATLRADYLDRPLSHAVFGQQIRNATVAVPPMSPAELERAITSPVATSGGSVEPGLVAQIVADTANLPSMLPLLQFALTELFELGDGRLTLANYERLGGVTGALVDRADRIYESFGEAQQTVAHGLFGRLTNVASVPVTSRRVLRTSLDDLGDQTTKVIDALGDARLLSFGHDSHTREPTVEVAHEALLQNWPRLVDWLVAERANLETVGRVRAGADEWNHNDCDDGALLRGVTLDAASQLVGTGWLDPDEGEFVAASVAARERHQNEQKAQLEREQRTSRRLRRLLVGVAALTVIALVAGGVALQQQRRADESADEAAAAAKQAEENADQAVAAQEQAEHEALISRAVSESGSRPTLGLLLAVEASLRNEGDSSDRALLSALNAVGGRVSVIEETRFENASPTPCLDVFGESSVYMVDVDILGPPQETTTHSVVDLATGEVSQFEAPSDCGPMVSPDGSTVLLNHFDPEAGVVAVEAWDVEAGSMIWASEPRHRVAGWLSDDVVVLRPSGDDDYQVSPPVIGNELVLANAASGEITGPAPFSGFAVVPSPDGEHWALQARVEILADAPPAITWQIVDRSGAALFEVGPVSSNASEVTWSDDGRYLALASQNNVPEPGGVGEQLWEVVIVDTTTMTVRAAAEIPHETALGGFAFTFREDNNLLVVTSEGVLLGLSPDGERVGPSDQLAQAGFATVPMEGDTYGLVLEDGTIEVHSPGRPGPVSRTFDCCSGATFLSDRNALVTERDASTEFVDIDSEEATELVWPDAPDGYRILQLGRIEDDYIAYILLDEEGEPAFLIDRDGELTVTPTIAEIGGSDAEFYQGFASPRGGALFIFSHVGGIRVVRADRDLTTEVERIEIDVDLEFFGIRDVDEAEEELTITDGEGSLITYDLTTGEEVVRLELSDVLVDWAIDLDGDGPEERYFAGRQSGEMFIVDSSDGSRSSTGYRAGFFRPRLVGEDRLLFADDRGAIRLLNAGSGEEVGVLIDLDNDAALGQVTLDGEEVIFPGVGDAPFAVALERDAWLAMACERAGRNLTEQEWEEFVPGDEPLRAGCPGL